jgi:ADP-ribose pyrophosphatase
MSDNKKWKVIKEEDISPSPWFPLVRQKVQLPNGKIINDYYLSKLGNVAMIVPFTSNSEVIFVKQYKHGAGQVILELPAGRIKKGNTPLKEAETELEEETGGEAEDFLPLGEVVFEPSKDTLRIHGFLATNVKINKKQKLDPTEDIEVVMVPKEEIEEMVLSGEIKASDTLAFLYMARLKYPEFFK